MSWSELLSGLSLAVSVVTLMVVLKIYLKESDMFADDAKAALAAQTTSITAAQVRVAANTVSPADQAVILGAITSNTAAIDQIAPATPQP